MAYSKELRERAIARLLPPINASLSAVSQELNIPYQTLYAWRTHWWLRSVLSTPVHGLHPFVSTIFILTFRL